ncbi:MAG: phosphatase PAP2 family protein, partial [Nocardioidaceae bacterium]|nr:phosphatase PAP2 family protein [Nocardioidaceae bacterium]
GAFASLPETYVSRLQDSMWADRVTVMADPVGAGTLQTIAAFASLHVGIMVTICLIVELVRMPRWVRVGSWVFLGLTMLATVYLGWHFVIDVLGGVVLGAFAVWIAGIATGNRVGLRARLAEAPSTVPISAPISAPATAPTTAPAGSASLGHPEALAAHCEPLPDHPGSG